MVWLLAIACQSGGGPPAARPFDSGGPTLPTSPDDTGEVDPPTDTGEAALGEPIPCAEPGPNVYRDVGAGELLPSPTINGYLAIEPGAAALIEAGGRRVLVWTQAEGPAVAADLDSGRHLAEDLGGIASGFSQADIDGDGELDLVVAGTEPVIVWDVGGDLADRTPIALRSGASFLRDLALGDLDGDGDIDGVALFGAASASPAAYAGQVFRNEGGRVLIPEDQKGVDDTLWIHPFDATLLDFDRDRDLDVHLCIDNPGGEIVPSSVLINNGRGVYSLGNGEGADIVAACMGTAWGDIDGDADLDLWFGEAHTERLLEDAGSVFIDVSHAVGMESWDSSAAMAWGGAIVDLDNDGVPEVVAAVSSYFRTSQVPLGVETWRRNNVGDPFVNTPWLPQAAYVHSVLARDLNGDGVIDLVLGDTNRTPHVLLSDACSAGNWLEVEAPPGTKATVKAGALHTAALVAHESSFGSSGANVAHFGLGDAAEVDEVTLDIPVVGRVVIPGPFAARRRVSWQPSKTTPP